MAINGTQKKIYEKLFDYGVLGLFCGIFMWTSWKVGHDYVLVPAMAEREMYKEMLIKRLDCQEETSSKLLKIQEEIRESGIRQEKNQQDLKQVIKDNAGLDARMENTLYEFMSTVATVHPAQNEVLDYLKEHQTIIKEYFEGEIKKILDILSEMNNKPENNNG